MQDNELLTILVERLGLSFNDAVEALVTASQKPKSSVFVNDTPIIERPPTAPRKPTSHSRQSKVSLNDAIAAVQLAEETGRSAARIIAETHDVSLPTGHKYATQARRQLEQEEAAA